MSSSSTAKARRTSPELGPGAPAAPGSGPASTTSRARSAARQRSSRASAVRSRGSSRAAPNARGLSRRDCSTARIARDASTTSVPMCSAQAVHASISSVAGGRSPSVDATSSSSAACERATRRTASAAVRFGIATGTTTLKRMPTAVPMRVFTMRTWAAWWCAETARMSIALIGVSRDCSPRRSSFASESDTAIARARLHHVRPIQVDTPTATTTPVSTAPTRTTPICSVPTVEACTTRSAVSGAVRSRVPGATSSAAT